MRKSCIKAFGALAAAFTAVPAAFAQATMPVGDFLDPPQIIASIIDVLGGNIFGIALGAFVLGAFLYILGGVDEKFKGKGKALMIGALVGFLVVRIAALLFGTVLLYLFAPPA